jgi:hypothetical protein
VPLCDGTILAIAYDESIARTVVVDLLDWMQRFAVKACERYARRSARQLIRVKQNEHIALAAVNCRYCLANRTFVEAMKR